MAPGTTAQLHLAGKPMPVRREIGAGQRGFVQRLLRRHGYKTRWGAGRGLVLRKQRRLPLQVNLSFEMRCARVWLAQLAAELRWSPQFVERRQHRTNFSQLMMNLVAWQSRQFTAINQYQTLVQFRKGLISLPGVALSLRSELRLAKDRIRETEPSHGYEDRFQARARRHHLRDVRGISRMRGVVISASKPDEMRGTQERRRPPIDLLERSFAAGLAHLQSHTADSSRSRTLAVQRLDRGQSRLERMFSHYFTDSTAVVPSSTATAADGRAGSAMRLRRPEHAWDQGHPHAFAPEMTLHRPHRNEDGQRQIAAALPEIITAVKAAGTAAPPAQPVGLAEPDLSQLTDQVYAELERKMRNERIRRGL